MNEQQIRKIVDDEINRKLFRLPKIPPHKHDGVDNIKIPASSVIPLTGAMGKITFSSNATYTLYFTSPYPQVVMFNGFALNDVPASATVYGYINGNANLAPTYYFQPGNSRAVETGGKKYPVESQFNLPNVPTQCSSCLIVDSVTLANANPHVDEFRIANVFLADGSNPATAVLNNLTPFSIDLTVTLTGNWQIVGNFTFV